MSTTSEPKSWSETFGSAGRSLPKAAPQGLPPPLNALKLQNLTVLGACNEKFSAGNLYIRYGKSSIFEQR